MVVAVRCLRAMLDIFSVGQSTTSTTDITSVNPLTGGPATCVDFQHAAVQIAFFAGLWYTVIGFLSMGWIHRHAAFPH